MSEEPMEISAEIVTMQFGGAELLREQSAFRSAAATDVPLDPDCEHQWGLGVLNAPIEQERCTLCALWRMRPNASAEWEGPVSAADVSEAIEAASN